MQTRRSLIYMRICCLIIMLTNCTVQKNNENQTIKNTPAPTSNNIVTITGWVTTIWNGEPHYFITDEQGKTIELLLDEELTKPLGGPLELDRKRVTVSGEMLTASDGKIQLRPTNIEIVK